MASTAVHNMADTSTAPATQAAGSSHTTAAHEPPAPPPPKPKRGRKKKDPDDKAKDPKEKEKKTTTRRPRASTAKASKDGDKETKDTSGASTASRKKQKLEHDSAVKIAPAQPVRQARISDLVSPADPVQAARHVSASAGSTSPPLLATARRNFTHPSINSPGAHAMTQGGSHESSPDPRPPYHSFAVNPDTASATPLQRPSGQNYDPIRSTTIETPTSFPQTLPSMVAARNTYSPPPNTNTPPPHAPFRASASPAISSIIDPPVPAAYKFVPTSLATSPRPATTEPVTSEKPQDKEIKERAAATSEPTTKDNENKLAAQKKGNNGSRAPSTGGASSPKPSRKEKDARPTGTGSGLLTNALFGVNMGVSTKDEKTAPDIILHVPLHGANNQVVNFARMAEDKYGFEALNPRVAAQKARRAEIDAASSALEKTEKNAKGDSGAEEDLSLDGEKDSDVDGDIVMGGTATTDANGTAASETTVQKRRRKVEDYDRDDPFVDDTEMVWQEQAATCKDGFFVYSGPLVPEGEKVTVERYVLFLPYSIEPHAYFFYRADGTIKRGRGRGRGGSTATHTHSSSDKPARGRGGAHNHTRDKDSAGIGNHPDAHNPSTDGPAPATTSGRGRGRGSGTTRKPRVTKADRAQMEREKAEREKAGLALAAAKKQEGA